MKFAFKLIAVAALLATSLAHAQQRPLVQLSDTPQYQQMLRDQETQKQQQAQLQQQQRQKEQEQKLLQLQQQQQQQQQQMQQLQLQRAGAVNQPR